MARALQSAIANFVEHMLDRETPACFSAKEYKGWLKLEKEAPTKPRAFVCRDCTSEFQREMRLQGRCFNSTTVLEKIQD